MRTFSWVSLVIHNTSSFKFQISPSFINAKILYYNIMTTHVWCTVDWEYFIGSKLAWAKYSTSFNFVKLGRVCIKVHSKYILCV